MVTNFLWKLVTTIALLVACFSIWDNNNNINKLEQQVCDTIQVQIDTIPTIDYYKQPEHFDERDAAIRDARATLDRFHCSFRG